MCGHQSQTSPFQLTPLGGMLKKVFRLNRNRCQSCQVDKLPMNPLGKGYQLQRQSGRRLPWPK